MDVESCADWLLWGVLCVVFILFIVWMWCSWGDIHRPIPMGDQTPANIYGRPHTGPYMRGAIRQMNRYLSAIAGNNNNNFIVSSLMDHLANATTG